MIFAAPVLAALASTLVVTNGGRSGGQRRRTGPIENPDEYYDEDGLVTSWRLANAEETAAIKDLVESGALTGLKPGQIKRNYPMFARFSNSLISSKVSNLRRGLADAGARRAEMEQKRGGGHGLTAHDNFFASRYGHNAEELFDERDDGSWVQVDDDDFEEDDGISRLGFDENTFASSFASNVHVRNTSSSIAGSLRTKKTTFHPSTKGPTTRPSQKILGVEKGAVTAKGGSCASYCTVHWLGTNSHGQSMRRVSHHIVFQSGDIMKSLKAARVSGDSKQFVLQMYRPKCLWDADIQCDWLHEEISSEYHMLPESQIETLFKMNPRRVGMARHAAKHFIPGEVPVDELRLDCAGIRVDPNFVTQSEDNVCNGASIWKEDDGTIRGNFELKELGKGSSESNRDIQWGINIGVMPAAFAFAGHVPSSISVGSKRNRGSSSKTTDDMEVDSSFHTYRGSAFDEEEEYFSPQNNGKKCDGHDQCFYDGFTGEEVVSECGSDMIEYALERAIANAECLYLEGKAEFEEQFGDGGGKPAAVPKKSPIQVETVASKDSDAYDGAPVASPKKKKTTTTAASVAASSTASSPRRSKRKAKKQEKADGGAEGPKEDDSSL